MTVRFWIQSDLHHERGYPGLIAPREAPLGADVLVLAGDIGSPQQVAGTPDGRPGLLGQWAEQHRIPAVAVAGNHEFYGREISEALSHLNGANRNPLVLFLDNSVATGIAADGTPWRVIGSTLWTDGMLLGDREVATGWARRGMTDFEQIRLRGTLISPEQTFEMHREAVSFIETALREPFDGVTVVLSHHAPHPNCIHAGFREGEDGLLSPMYASDLSRLLNEDWSPTAWVHGHVHQSADFMVGRTRIIANPRGYQRKSGIGFENSDFRYDLVVDVEPRLRPKPGSRK